MNSLRLISEKINMKKQNSKKNLRNLDRERVTGLGEDYGLIFKGLGICTSRDGKRTTNVRKLLSERDLLYRIYFDKTRNKLYYAEKDSMDMWHRLYEWPAKIVKHLDEEYGKVSVEDMIRYKSSLLLALRKEDVKDIIVDLAGNKIASGRWIKGLVVFKKELYHIDERGLVRTKPDEVVAKNNCIESLTSLDKIYYGCYDGEIYSYDGVGIEKIYNVSFSRNHVSPVMSLKSVEDSDGQKIYIGRLNEKGILVTPLDNPQRHYTILRNKAFEVNSMALAPLKFIDEMNKKTRAL